MQRTGFLPPLAPLLRAHLCDLGEFGKGALVGEHEGHTDSLDAACGSSGPRQNQQIGHWEIHWHPLGRVHR